MFTVLRRAVADRLAPSTSWGRRTPDDIDSSTIARALGLDPVSVAGLQVQRVDHGTSLRSQLTLSMVDGTTRSLFAKNTPVAFGPGLLDGLTRLCERETKFYRHLAPDIPSAPQAVLSEWDSRTGRSTVVLADFSEQGYAFEEASQPCSVTNAAAFMRHLGDLHGATVTTADRPGLHALDPIFALNSPTMRLVSRIATRTVGKPARSLTAIVPADVLAKSRILSTHAREYTDVLAGFPQAFIHNDTHRGNIGFAEDRAILIDWQNCGWGPALKDVAYFLSTSLEPEDRRQHEHDLLALYLQAFEKAGGPHMDRDEACFAYRVLVITGYVAAAVTALFRERLQAAANAEQGLRRAVAAVQDLDSFAALDLRIKHLRSDR